MIYISCKRSLDLFKIYETDKSNAELYDAIVEQLLWYTHYIKNHQV